MGAHLLIRELIIRIQIHSQRAFEHCGVLRYNSHLLAQHIHGKTCRRNAIDTHAAAAGLNETEESDQQRALAAASAADNRHFRPVNEMERHAVESQRQRGSIAQATSLHCCILPRLPPFVADYALMSLTRKILPPSISMRVRHHFRVSIRCAM